MPAPNSNAVNFERTVANIAFAQLRSDAPSLLDFLTGFQIIDKNDDETRAVGVFGFKVGRDWIYAPRFYLNGELKGKELMWVKEQDAFLPMTEEWVNYVLNRRPHLLGEPEKTPRHQLGLRQPDFDIFARAPYVGSKYASAPRRTIGQLAEFWAKSADAKLRDMVPFLDVFRTAPDDPRYERLQHSFTVPGALNRLGKRAQLNFLGTVKNDPLFAEALLRLYDTESLLAFRKQGAETEVEKPKTVQVGNQDDLPFRKGKDNYPTVTVLKGHDGSNTAADLSDTDRTKLLVNGYVVHDPRKEDQRSRLYKSQIAQTWNGVSENGVYDVLQGDGSCRKLLVLTDFRPLGSKPRKNFTVLIDPDKKQYANYHPSDLLVSKQFGRLKPDMDGTTGLDDLQRRDTAILLGPGNQATGVFTVHDLVTGTDGRTEYDVWGENRGAHGSVLLQQSERESRFTIGGGDDDIDVRKIVLTGKEGGRYMVVGGTLFVPTGWRAMIIRRPPMRKDEESRTEPSPDTQNSSELLSLGPLNELLTNITKKAVAEGVLTRLQIEENGLARFRIREQDVLTPWLNKAAAVRHLIVGCGLGEPETETLLEDAARLRTEHKPPAAWFLKRAYGEPPKPASFPDPIYGDEYGIRAPIQYPQTQLENLSQNDDAGARDLQRDDRYIDDSAKRYATTASNLGQKEVLDTAVISGLVKTLDVDSRLDGFVPDLKLGLDRLGRILFMFYWHNDAFTDRFGKQDMTELEDNLRNVFKNLGEVILYVQQKTVEPDRAQSSEVELPQVF